MLERSLGDGAHFFEVRLRVRETDLLLDVSRSGASARTRSLKMSWARTLSMRACGPAARVPGPGIVLHKRWVGEKERRHGCACRVLIVGRVRTPC